jgi:signal transduction histidine kinase
MDMTPHAYFQTLRPALQKRASTALAQGAGVRKDFLGELNKFFDLLEQALLSGNPSHLDSLLQEWTSARTQSDLQEGERNVTALLNQLIQLTSEAARENLPAAEALPLIGALTPIYLHATERVTTYENETRLNYLQTEIDRLQKKAERLDRSKSNFISVAAHEFKTPLTLVEGYAAMITELLPPELQQIHNLVQGIHNGIHRLRALVDDMIDVSQIDNNLMSLNPQPVWLNRTLNLLQAELESTLKQRKQSLQVHPFEGSKELLFADPERLYQALKNIVSNAIKYTPDGGRIEVDGRILPGFVEITISDTGIGIDPENQEVIFEKFGQLGSVLLHSSGKTKFKGGGPGLGLPIAKGIVEMHGGSLWVESPGYDEIACPGSTFHLLLPLRQGMEENKLAKFFSVLQR